MRESAAALKQRLMDAAVSARRDEDTALAERRAAGYLGLVLRAARESFLQAEEDTFRGFSELRWELNLGMPSPHADRGSLEERFLAVANAAWELSLEPRYTLADACRVLADASRPDGRQRSTATGIPLALIPEIVAGAASFARSDSRRDGLHFLLDIGASTADLGVCVIHRPIADDHWSMLYSAVEPLGMLDLSRRVMDAVERADPGYAADLRDQHDLSDPMAGDVPIDFERDSVTAAVDEAEDQFEDDLQRMIGSAIEAIRIRRNPKAPELWRADRSLPILVMGGGKTSRTYARLLTRWDYELRKKLGTAGLDQRDVPIPAELEDASESHGHRLAVALGLAYREPDIGHYTPPGRIADVELRPVRPRGTPFVGKDHV